MVEFLLQFPRSRLSSSINPAPAPVVEYISQTVAVSGPAPAMKYFSQPQLVTIAPAPVQVHSSTVPAMLAATALVVEYFSSALAGGAKSLQTPEDFGIFAR